MVGYPRGGHFNIPREECFHDGSSIMAPSQTDDPRWNREISSEKTCLSSSSSLAISIYSRVPISRQLNRRYPRNVRFYVRLTTKPLSNSSFDSIEFLACPIFSPSPRGAASINLSLRGFKDKEIFKIKWDRRMSFFEIIGKYC